MIIKPAKKIVGRLQVPGDKSISHRAAIIASLARGTSELRNFSTSYDCAATLHCLKELGVGIEQSGNTVSVSGRGLGQLTPPKQDLDCGNSGSTMRMLAGVLAGQGFTATLNGDSSLRARPMQRIIEPLELMGARVSSTGGGPPLTITGTRELKGTQFHPAVASAQVKTCILFAGLHAHGRTVLRESQRTRDHTERLLDCFGVRIRTLSEEGELISLDGPQEPVARQLDIGGDISSAAFFIAAAALLDGSNLSIVDVGLNPTRTRFIESMELLGFEICLNREREECSEPIGTVRVPGGQHHERSDPSANRLVAPDLIAQLIDELPLLAVVGTKVKGGIEIRGAAELRLKESDRISATVKNLHALGVKVEEFADGLYVPGPQELRGGKLESYGDHRIAMAFTVAALLGEGESELSDAECVRISFPEFFELLESVVER